MKHYLMICVLAFSYHAYAMEINEKIEDVKAKYALLKKLVNERQKYCDAVIRKWEAKAPKTDNLAEIRKEEYKAGIEDMRDIRAFFFENRMAQEVKEVNGNIVLQDATGFTISPIGKVLELGSIYANADGKVIPYIKEDILLPYLEFFVQGHIGTEAIDGCAMPPAQCLKHAVLHQRVKFVRFLVSHGFKQYADEKLNSETTTRQYADFMCQSYHNILTDLKAKNADRVRQQNADKSIRRFVAIRSYLTVGDAKI